MISFLEDGLTGGDAAKLDRYIQSGKADLSDYTV